MSTESRCVLQHDHAAAEPCTTVVDGYGAGSKERLREALDEVLRPYFDLAGMNAETVDKVLAGATARLSSFHGIAADLAAVEAAARELLDAESQPAYSWVIESQEARNEGRPNREVERMDRISKARAALRAALAATPTQTGAEGPAAEALDSALSEFDNVRWDDVWEGLAIAELVDLAAWTRRYVGYVRTDIVKAIAALRSGAEVAAAPGLAEAATLLATFVTEGRIEHRTRPASERCRELMPTDGTCDCGLREARALAARLTDNPS